MVGFTLTELLVALSITICVLAAALAAFLPVSSGVLTVPEHADVQQRVRVLVEALRTDVMSAAHDAAVGAFSGSGSLWPPVRPCGWGQDPVTGARGPCARPYVLSVVTAWRPLQVLTAAPQDGPSHPLHVARPPGCRATDTACQFVPGDAIVIADGWGRADIAEVQAASTDGEWLALGGALSAAYPKGAVLIAGRVRTYYAREDAASGLLQVRRLDGTSDLPVVDHVSAFSVEYFGEPDAPAVSVGADLRRRPAYGPAPRPVDPGDPALGVQGSCAFARVGEEPVSRLEPLPSEDDGLAVLPLARFSDGPWCPDDLAPARFDLDTFRIRRIRVTVRTEAPLLHFRGQDPAYFGRAGTARDAARLVPGLAVQFDVAIRGFR